MPCSLEIPLCSVGIKAMLKGEESLDTRISEGFSGGKGHGNITTVKEKECGLFGENALCGLHTRQHGEICLGRSATGRAR